MSGLSKSTIKRLSALYRQSLADQREIADRHLGESTRDLAGHIASATLHGNSVTVEFNDDETAYEFLQFISFAQTRHHELKGAEG